MISFNFSISNPWIKRFENLWCRGYSTPFKNKFIELEVTRDTTILTFNLRLSTRQSHGGLYIELGLLGYVFSFNFYDNRHWNYKADRYFEAGEE